MAQARRRIARPRAGRVRPGRDRRGRGGAAFTGGDEASRHLQAAAALFEQAPRRVLAAELWCDAARAGAGRWRGPRAAVRRARPAPRRRAGRGAASAPRAPVGCSRQLTSRERDVVLLAAEGLTNREIGARLYLSEGTVRNYLSTAFAKLGVRAGRELGRLVGSDLSQRATQELAGRASAGRARRRRSRAAASTAPAGPASQTRRSAGVAGCDSDDDRRPAPRRAQGRDGPRRRHPLTAGCAHSSRSTSAGATL